MLDFLIHFWDENFKNFHGSDQGANIDTAIVLGALHLVCKILQTLSELGCKLWVSTVKGMILHYLYIGPETMLDFFVVVVLSVLLLLFFFYRHPRHKIMNCSR